MWDVTPNNSVHHQKTQYDYHEYIDSPDPESERSEIDILCDRVEALEDRIETLERGKV